MRYNHLDEEILEYNDTHVYTSEEDSKWAVNDWYNDKSEYAYGPCITHYCYQRVYQTDAWNYAVSPVPGNRYWDLQFKNNVVHDLRTYYRCTECMAPAPDDVRTVFMLYRDKK